jgi:hypothetical protein
MLHRNLFVLTVLFAFTAAAPPGALGKARQTGSQEAGRSGVVSGELKKWHRVTILFDGPGAAEQDGANPFLDYRLDVTFISPSGQTRRVPGHYAADGDAAETGAAAGNKWRVYFTPDEEGSWSYTASFRQGKEVAVSADAGAGAPTSFDGASNVFRVGPTDKAGRDHRGKGLLGYAGRRYWQFRGTGEYFIKGGANSPETLLGYDEFDATYVHDGGGFLHRYAPHVADWRAGDPTWRGGRGKGLIGALNYLAGKGMNAVYFLTLSAYGDGRNVWPWTAHAERRRYDVSKLDQWEVVFSHMDKLGLMLHVVTQETENDQLLDGGALGVERKLYYRELVSRFGHHPALVWNLGEENTNTAQERAAFAAHLRALDAYAHPVVVHSYPEQHNVVYPPLLGSPFLEGMSVQTAPVNVRSVTREWLSRSAAAGRQWVVSVDEINPAEHGVLPDANDPTHDGARRDVLWANLMAGGAGVEWYFGYNWAHNDLNCEDWRSRERMWDQTRHALDFFRQHLPFSEMSAADELAAGAYTLAKAGEVYAVYLPYGGTTELNLTLAGAYTVQWYNPREGGALQTGTLAAVGAPGVRGIGYAPFAGDAVALIKRASGVTFPPPPPVPTPTSGLKIEYYDDRNLTALRASGVSPQVSFNWGSAAPHASLTNDNEYGVRWVGEVLIDRAGAWNFYTVSNDGVRLFIDGQPVIDNWSQHRATEDRAGVSLSQGWHRVELRYFQQGGTSEISLSFEGPGQPKAVVPADRLRH